MTYKSKWKSDEKIRIVLEALNTNVSTSELCRKHNVTPNAFYSWMEKLMQGGKLALSRSLKDPAKERDAEIEIEAVDSGTHDCKRRIQKNARYSSASEKEKKILRAMARSASIDVEIKEIKRNSSCEYDTLKEMMRRLTEKGLIFRTERAKCSFAILLFRDYLLRQ